MKFLIKLFLIILLTNTNIFAVKLRKLPDKPLDVKVQRLSFESIDIQSFEKNYVFNIKCSKNVKYASLAIGLVPGKNAIKPVYRIQLKSFPNSDNFKFSLKKSKLIHYLINDISLAYYKLTLIDKKGYSEIFESRFSTNRKGQVLNTVIYGPYLDFDEFGTYTISYELSKKDNSTLILDNVEYKSEKPKKRHFFKFKNLKKGKHTYKIKNDMREFTFEINNNPSFKFAVLSDCREGRAGFDYNMQAVNGKILNKLMLQAKNENAEIILVPGDLVSGYTTNHEDFRKQLKSFAYCTEPISSTIPVFEGMGNHEATFDMYFDKPMVSFDKLPPNSAEDIFADVFVNPTNCDLKEKEGLPSYKENVYWFKYKNNLFVMLNTNYWWASHPEFYHGNLEGYLMDKQLKWLEETLEKQGKNVKNTFVFTHEPAFPVSAHMKDAMWYHGGLPEFNKGIDRKYVIKRRDEILKILDKHNVKLIFFGDEHNYSRVLINKDIAPIKGEITQIITGGAGAPFYNLAKKIPWKKNVKAFGRENHYMLVEVTDSVKVKAISIDGSVIDSFEIK